MQPTECKACETGPLWLPFLVLFEEGGLLFCEVQIHISIHTYIPEAPNVPFFVGIRGKKRSNYRFLLDPPKNTRPPKNARPHPLLPSRGRRDCYVFFIFLMHSFADMCARFADICARFALRFLLAPFEYSATDHLGGPTGAVLGKTLEAGKSVRLPYFGDDPWFCNTFGLRQKFM